MTRLPENVEQTRVLVTKLRAMAGVIERVMSEDKGKTILVAARVIEEQIYLLLEQEREIEKAKKRVVEDLATIKELRAVIKTHAEIAMQEGRE
jgi:hypothetical protein